MQSAGAELNYSDSDNELIDEDQSLQCLECNLAFSSKHYLYDHLLHHVKQPFVKLDKIDEEHPPLKITLKNRKGNSFEIVSSPASSAVSSADDIETFEQQDNFEGESSEDLFALGFGEGSHQSALEYGDLEDSSLLENDQGENRTTVCFSPNLAEVIGESLLGDISSPVGIEEESVKKEEPENTDNTAGVDAIQQGNNAPQEYGSIPGAEPTPPPEPSPTEYPKIKIKTTGLFKDPEPERCTITEITDDNPTGDPNLGNGYPNNSTPVWTTPSLEDPLKLPEPEENNIMALFNNNDKAKDLGFSTSSDNEFISLDTYNERNRGALQLYNPNQAVSSASSSSLDSLTGLPMQALAQQVSRLQPSNSQGMHQQNVLINIQQFPTQQGHYQHPPMYPPMHPYPPHPGQPPMHQPYQYQPPNPMYYPPAPGYPPQHSGPHMPPPPPQHQMGQMQPPPPMNQQPQMNNNGQPPNSMNPSSQSQPMAPNQMQQSPNQMQGVYRPPLPPAKPPAPRGPVGGPRMPPGPRGPMNPRGPMARPRAPMIRPRGPGATPMRGPVRPRMGAPQNGMRPNGPASNVKRSPDQANAMAKRKKLDVLTPSDKDDDDCQVICMQPKNTDGGLPQIESVQGASESAENSIMHLSDSITLSVRNPPPKPVVSPQKSDAKAVANILATRGITVTATAKPKEKENKQGSAIPTALSLNGAVSIVASPKTNGTNNSKPASENLPTVDLTDDTPTPKPATPTKKGPGLPFRCDLCPAQYPNAMSLNKHRQTYHKTTGGMAELGIPLINLKQAGIMMKLTQLGIHSYIPLPSAGSDGTYAFPIINTKQACNVSALGATQMLTLGPVRSIPRPTIPSSPVTPKK